MYQVRFLSGAPSFILELSGVACALANVSNVLCDEYLKGPLESNLNLVEIPDQVWHPR